MLLQASLAAKAPRTAAGAQQAPQLQLAVSVSGGSSGVGGGIISRGFAADAASAMDAATGAWAV